MTTFSNTFPRDSYETIEQDRKTRLLRLFCRIAIGLMICLLLPAVVRIASGKFEVLLTSGWEFISFFFYIFSYWLAGVGRYRLGSWLFALAPIGSITEFLFKQVTISWILVMCMIALVAFTALMQTKEMVLISAYFIIVVFILNLLQILQRPNLPSNPLELAGTIFLSSLTSTVWLPAITAGLVLPTRSQTRLLQAHNHQLQKTLSELETRQQTGQVVSQQVLSLSSELKSTAGQQALDSQQQAGVVAQLNVSASELFSAANTIASLSEQVSQTALLVAEESQRIEETTQQAVSQSQAGTEAVSHTTTAIQEMSDLYKTLVDQLDELNSRNANTRRILDLIRAIASETHLLALNASIEAAGAGEYGDRFSIIAQEVKDLAIRSANAGKEVVDIVRSIGDMTRQAVQSAQTGLEKAQQMQQLAEQSDKVISQLRQVATTSQGQAGAISEAIQMIVQLTQLINTTTGQQRNSGEQIVEALSGLSHVAQRNAAGGSQLSSTATQMEQVSSRLNLTLAA